MSCGYWHCVPEDLNTHRPLCSAAFLPVRVHYVPLEKTGKRTLFCTHVTHQAPNQLLASAHDWRRRSVLADRPVAQADQPKGRGPHHLQPARRAQQRVRRQGNH